MKKLRVDIWSDIACPWCYVGKRRMEAALARFPHRDQVEVLWRAFELDPSRSVSAPDSGPYAERLARKYGTSVLQARGMISRMTQVAAAEGLSFQFDRIRPTNTFDAHRVLHLAKASGVQVAVKERLLRAYFTEGENLGDREVLARLAAEAGLAVDEVRRMLNTDEEAAAVRADEKKAHALGITGVPFFVFDDRFGVSGAQPAEVLLQALLKAWSEAGDTSAPDAASCGPDGCM